MRQILTGRTSSPFARRLAAGVVAALAAVALHAPRAGAQPADGWGDRSAQQHSRKPRDQRVHAVLRAAKSQLGTPYRYGGSSPGGFDCSGFTRWAWQHGGDTLPHSASAQYGSVRQHVQRGHLQPGDLLFFYSPISHVAIFLGGNKMIEAPHSGARVRIVQIYWQYYSGAARPA